MKHVKNIVTKGLSGKIQDLVFRQRYGKTIVSSFPTASKFPATESQQLIRFTFKDAVRYAKAILLDDAIKMAYLAKTKAGQTPFNLAVADFFKMPIIGNIEVSGNSIKAYVTDDFKVMAVEVRIENSSGVLLESGAANIMMDGLHYNYNTTSNAASIAGNRIIVSATDLPGHLVTKQITV